MKQHRFSAKGVRSLAWRGDELVDWVGGGRAFKLDGAEVRAQAYYAYRFDSAIASPDGRYAVLYEKLGTKALLLKDGKIMREIDRSYYCAEAYEFPVVLFHAPKGRLVLAHCPQSYRRIEFEEVETGAILTHSKDREPADFFHSRLIVSPGGKRMLSAGWVWHPWSSVVTFDVARALTDPEQLDRTEGVQPPPTPEIGSACWLDDDRMIIGGSASEERLDDEQEPESGLPLRGLAIYDVARGSCERAFDRDEPPGTMFAVDEGRVLSLYRHPKLIDLNTGTTLHVWGGLYSGLQDSSIVRHLEDDALPPPMAFDAVRKRFAIANGDSITVIDF